MPLPWAVSVCPSAWEEAALWAVPRCSSTQTATVPAHCRGQWTSLVLTHTQRILYTRHVTNASVRQTTGSHPVFFPIKPRRLCFFGHVACLDSRQDHHRAISVSLRPPGDWRRRRGHPRTTWPRRIDADVQSTNTGIHLAWRMVNDCVLWQHTSTRQYSTSLKAKIFTN